MSNDFERRLRGLRSRLPEPDAGLTARVEGELTDVLRGTRAAGPTPRRRARIARGLLLVSVGLLLGSGLGFELGHSAGPPAIEPLVARASGVGFVPARGWTTVQRGFAGSEDSSALAVNVRLRGNDLAAAGYPEETLATLPRHGIIISAMSHGTAVGADFPRRGVPLRLRDGVRSFGAWPRRLVRYHIRGNVRGHNVAVEVVFGTASPPRAALAEANRQLARLFVGGAPSITIAVQPTLVSAMAGTRVFGRVSEGGPSSEHVRVEARDCADRYFRTAGGAALTSGGNWATDVHAYITTTFRARWKNSTSDEVRVVVRPHIVLGKPRRNRYPVTVQAEDSFGGKRAVLQRFSEATGRWVRVKVFRLQAPSWGHSVRWSVANPRASVRRGTPLRVVLPKSQVGRCYAAGISNTIRR